MNVNGSVSIGIRYLVSAASMSLLVACGPVVDEEAVGVGNAASIIFKGSHIVTMDENNLAPEAVAVRDEKIIFVGSEEGVKNFQGPDTRLVELGDRALLPGFIDAHGHFSSMARAADLVDLSSPPVGVVEEIDDIVRLLRLSIENERIPAGQQVDGFGYDDSLLEEGRHPTRNDLDRASTEHPIVIRHVSGHLLAANSLALSSAGVTATTPDPAGGVVRRNPDGSPNGVMEETAMGLLPAGNGMTDERFAELRREALTLYASYGITTIQDSNLSLEYIDLMRKESAEQSYPIDLVAYAMGNGMTDDVLDGLSHEGTYSSGFRMGGVKFILDGSPQGRTAWMTEPYDEGPPGAAADYVAYPSYPPETYKQRIPKLIDRGMPVLVHVNGDAAIDLMLDGIDAIPKPLPDHRTVAIHAQLAREDQLDRIKALGVVPSYYAVHPFFWGDWHRLSFGEARASFISPIASTVEREIPFTIHNDSPIVPPDIMRLLSIAVNRETRSGYILGPDQRASVEQALYSVTRGAAYQYFEESRKGSIEVGKQADLVILASNPLRSDPALLADIDIEETFSRGRSVYSAPVD
ncbi:MAG: amidohydrolase [Gammaproteobacteria bacterium]|nr:amidohydrolase [Gammaproteobacteria bacterium]